MGKYDGEIFNDPAVRCTECQRIIFKEELQVIGRCPGCGCRKVRNVTIMNDSEIKLMVNKKVDQEFIDLFVVEGIGG